MSSRRSHSEPSRRYHNRVARQYDSIYDDAYWEFHDELTWRLVRSHLPRDLSQPCLDLGCGTGKWGLKLLKVGLPVTFLDHAPAMIEQARRKTEALGPRSRKATLLVADIVDLSALAADHFALTLAMGDPLSMCVDPQRAAREMFRVCRPGGVVIASADNKLAALDHFAQRGDLDELEQFVRSGRTRWLTREQSERFELTMFTPASLRRLFEQAGFEVLGIEGKTILPVRSNSALLQSPQAIDRLLRLEEHLSRDPAAAARASHLQARVRKP